ncbi:TPA: hypothetical protein N0F65_007377 [Lagenidium giganteum]|uniref:Major facilitator superfamily (MFS) profile domain-containing protein n=1 Tax=Lagenidium giganteum TaxID=4803 RepID=A0AAV2YI11_9STRA|nr:TPA: hypothetical protein N0F65_007377 [Lagenidium giganteum]
MIVRLGARMDTTVAAEEAKPKPSEQHAPPARQSPINTDTQALSPEMNSLSSTAPRSSPVGGCCATKAGVFTLTFFSYVMFHASRKSFSAIKGEMSAEQWIHSSLYSKEQQAQMYGLLDTLFMAFYAVGLYISGILGDNYDLRKMIAGGMWCTAAIVLLFGLGAMAEIHALSFYAILWGLNGLIQSCGWPANVAVMYVTCCTTSVLGIWSGNACFGNIVGTALVATMFAWFDKTIAWKFSMVLAAFLVALHGTIIYIFLVPDPKDAPYRHEALENAKPDTVAKEMSPKVREISEEDTLLQTSPCCGSAGHSAGKGISFLDAWCIPGVIPYSLSYACLKSVNYALFFWLPFYLTVQLGLDNSTADYFSMLYDLGQIFGGFAGGYITDKMGVRSPVIVVISAIYCIHGSSVDVTAVLLVVSGFMLGGPANLISTAISADLGTHESIRGDASALSTVTGIIDGTGSVGAALVQYLVGYLAQCHKEPRGCDEHDPRCIQVCSWGPVFVLLEVGTLLACVCLTRLLYHELLIIRSRRQDAVRSN